MNDKPSVLRETDDEARKLARILLRSARHAALAVIDPETGFPSASRALIGTDIDGVPVILVSALSAHTKALTADPRASLLVGEPGKGDPLAHPRLGVQCVAERVERESPGHQRTRARFLRRHPKASLYIDFPDFCFFRLQPRSASLNGGFGRAYVIPGEDFEISSPASEAIAAGAEAIIADLQSHRLDIAGVISSRIKGHLAEDWRIIDVDAAGFDFLSGEKIHRFEFDQAIERLEYIDSYRSKLI
jgi:putative heme iron utilization protein